MKTAEEFLKERDIPNEVITVQRDGFIEGNRVSFLMEEFAKLTDSAGEEVYVECNEDEADLYVSQYIANSKPMYLKKLTRPTVTEEEIIQELQNRLEAGRHYLMSTGIYDVSAREALEALGYDENGDEPLRNY
jgi:hypothetical protein